MCIRDSYRYGRISGLYGFVREILSSGRGDVRRHAAGAGKRRAFHFFGILYHTARQNVGWHCGDPQAQGNQFACLTSFHSRQSACKNKGFAMTKSLHLKHSHDISLQILRRLALVFHHKVVDAILNQIPHNLSLIHILINIKQQR